MTIESREVVVQEPLAIAPRQVVAAAREQATVLMEIVEDKKLYVVIGGKKHLEAEAWETILAFNKVHPVPRSVTPIFEGEEITGYLAQVDLMKDGEVVSSGFMPCGFDDFPCRGKEGMAKHKAAMSAAQTWALSKAARLKFAWVVVLAGYAPTPAEEMSNDDNAMGTPRPQGRPMRSRPQPLESGFTTAVHGSTPDWSAFWAGKDRAALHNFFEIDDHPGAMTAKAQALSILWKLPLAATVDRMRWEFENRAGSDATAALSSTEADVAKPVEWETESEDAT